MRFSTSPLLQTNGALGAEPFSFGGLSDVHTAIMKPLYGTLQKSLKNLKKYGI